MLYTSQTGSEITCTAHAGHTGAGGWVDAGMDGWMLLYTYHDGTAP